MALHQVVSQEEWLAARRTLLAQEKELTRARDALCEARRALPWVKVDKEYTFEGPNGQESLSDLFAGRSQLIVYHFMFGPGWEEGCTGCSFLSDHIDAANLHLAHHDVTLLVCSRAPYQELASFKERMGWQFKWVSSNGSDFNYDYHVSYSPEQLASGQVFYNYRWEEGYQGQEQPGGSVFYKNEAGDIFHTYGFYARGGDELILAHTYLDMTPLGRNEGPIMNWVRHHDKYEGATSASCRSSKENHS